MAVVFPVPMRSEGLPARGGPEIPKVDVPGQDEKEAEACAQARDWSTSPPSKERGADKLNFTSLFATWVDVFLQKEQRRPGSGLLAAAGGLSRVLSRLDHRITVSFTRYVR